MNHDQFPQYDDTDLDHEFGRALGAQLRRQVDQVGGHGASLAAAATRTGRRRVALRRVATGGALAAVAAGVALTVPQLTHGSSTLQVAGSPTPTAAPSDRGPSSTPFATPPIGTASTMPRSNASGSVMPQPTPSAVPASATATVSPAMLAGERAILQRHLSGSRFAVESASQVGVTGVATDAQGQTWVMAAVQKQHPGVKWTCTPSAHCQVSHLASGTLYVQEDGDHAGDGHWYTLLRADHTVVQFAQVNALQGGGSVTRPTIPLTLQQVSALMSDPQWNQLAPMAR